MLLKESPFICPVCKNKLFELDGSFRCLKSHSFDKAKQGYINLLMKNSSGKRHGDDKIMVAARRNFLLKGYYEPLRNAVSKIAGNGKIILDAGCGEGYYTSEFEKENTVYGIDISKDAVKYAAARCKKAKFAVASLSDIPLANESIDTVINIFAPDINSEFLRVLKSGGRLITVMPMENHLKELKNVIYENPYLNPPVSTSRTGFELINKTELKYKITLDSNEDINALFKMTPYYYKTSASDQAKLENLTFLETGIEFLIAEYKKI